MKKVVVQIKLIFSPDDEDKTGKGWYFEERSLNTSGNWRTSQLFSTQSKANDAWKQGNIKWE